MADSRSNAPLRADAGAAPTSGVIHVRTRLTADFTVISNALAQRRGSAVTVGVAAYVSSLPDGTCVSIAALCDTERRSSPRHCVQAGGEWVAGVAGA